MRSLRPIAFAATMCAALFVAGLLAQPAFADEPLVGTWKVVSWVMDDLYTKEQKPYFGQHPQGFAIFTADKHFMILITAEGRQGGQTEADRARNFMTSYATAGTYRVEGSKYFLTIEVSQGPALVGSVAERDFKIEGNRMTVTTAPERTAAVEGHMTQSTLVWEHVAP